MAQLKDDCGKQVARLHAKIDSVSAKRDAFLEKSKAKSREELDSNRKRKKYDFYSSVIGKAFYRIRNRVDDLHRHLAKKLVDNYEIVVVGKFDVSGFKKGKLSSGILRDMRTWGHFRFRNFLLHKAREVEGCQVFVQDEHFTSKTCGRCGVINNLLGGKEVFVCQKCGYETDRDVNGARNILKKYLGVFRMKTDK